MDDIVSWVERAMMGQAGPAAASGSASAAASRAASAKKAPEVKPGPQVKKNSDKPREAAPAAALAPKPVVKKPGAPAAAASVHRSAGCSIDDALSGDSWGIDTMASVSISGNRALFGSLTRCAEVRVKVANGQIVRACHTGTVRLKFLDSRKRLVSYTLDQVLYHPDFASNLLCVARLTRHKNWVYHADGDGTYLITPDGAKIPVVTTGKVSILLGAGTERVYGAIRAESPNIRRLVLLHERLSHMGLSEMVKLVRSGRTDLGKVELSEADVEAARMIVRECAACALGKQTRTALDHRGLETGTKAGEVLHMDSYVVKFQGRDGQPCTQHSVSIKDTCSGEGYQLIVDTKDQIAGAVIEKLRQIERQSGGPVKVIHSDGGSEFVNSAIKNYVSQQGIYLRLSPPYTPQLNGAAERSVRTCKDLARAVLHHASAPLYLWSAAMDHVVWLWNRTRINNPMGKTAYEQHTGRVPQISARFVGVWGCDVYVLLRKDQREGAMAPVSEPGIYLGHSDRFNAPRVLLLGSGKIKATKDVKFLGTFRNMQAYVNFETQVPPAAAGGDAHAGEGSGGQFEDAQARGGDDGPSTPPGGLGGSSTVTSSLFPADRDKTEYKVDRIVARHVDRRTGAEEFQVHWAGYDDGEDTWEPLDSVKDTAAYQNFLDAETAKVEAREAACEETRASRVTRSHSDLHSDSPDGGDTERASAVRVEMAYSALLDAQSVDELSTDHDVVFSAVSAGVDDARHLTPTTREEARRSTDAARWEAADRKEYDSCVAKGVWTPIRDGDLPTGVKPLPIKEVFKIKLDENGAVSQFKVRWTVRGDYQKPGRDYTIGETFARTAMHKTERVALSLASRFDSELVQFDVPTAFLNADVKEDVYVRLPADYGGTIVKLNKALYGLVQAPAEWDKLISTFITKDMGWTATVSDPSFYFKRSRTGRLMLIYRFVDDMQGQYHKEDEAEFAESSKLLRERFSIKKMDTATWMLGMRITRDRRARTIKLDQTQYITQTLAKYGFAECKVASSPEVPGADTAAAPGLDAPTDRQRYMEMVGSLMYAAISTRLDIAHAVHYLASAMQAPTVRHLIAAQRVFRYLAGTKDVGLVFGNGELGDSRGHAQLQTEVCAYGDASWGDKVFGRKSLTGWVAKINGDVYAWAAKKQSVVALSTCEAELYAQAEACKEVMWVRILLRELELHARTGSPASRVYGDNQGTNALTKNGIKSERTKHIDIKWHFVTDAIANKIVDVVWVPTNKQDADIFTKALSTPVFEALRARLMSR